MLILLIVGCYGTKIYWSILKDRKNMVNLQCRHLSKNEKMSLYSFRVSSDKFSLAFSIAASLSLISSSSMLMRAETRDRQTEVNVKM